MSLSKNLSEREFMAVTTAVTIVIPAYNEENGIGPTLDQLQATLAETGATYEVIVVDDGSVDGTAQVLAGRSDIRLLRHRENRGYGAALKTGIRHASAELVCITDADGTYPNERIPELARQLIDQNHDMVVGARTGQNVAIPLIRRPAKWVIGQLANFVAGMHIPDINSGMRIFRREVGLRFLTILPDGFSFTTTITLALLTNGYLVDYVPIDYYARVGKSKIRPIRDTLNFVQLILRMALYFAPLKIFFSLSVLLMLLGLVWGVLSRIITGQVADVSTLVIVTTGIQAAMMGMLAEIINRRFPNYYREE